MRPSRIILLLVALIAGGLAAFLATRGTPPPQQATRTEVVQERKTQILVAVEPIGVGQRLNDKLVQWFDWPDGSVRPEYIAATTSPDGLEQIDGAVARFEIFPGDPILESKLVRTEQGYLSAVLEQGKRGISIAVSADSASGGFIVPNDHVDVVLSRTTATGLLSQTLLENVKVLAINTRLGETGSTGEPADPESKRAEVFRETAIATLELDPIQGETVINAAKIGTLSLALRSIQDFEGVTAQPVRSNSQAVRMIKYGAPSSVMAGSSNPPSEASIDPAAYPVPTETVFIEPPVIAEPTPVEVTTMPEGMVLGQ
jgi:pilus assembly protein CpaB